MCGVSNWSCAAARPSSMPSVLPRRRTTWIPCSPPHLAVDVVQPSSVLAHHTVAMSTAWQAQLPQPSTAFVHLETSAPRVLVRRCSSCRRWQVAGRWVLVFFVCPTLLCSGDENCSVWHSRHQLGPWLCFNDVFASVWACVPSTFFQTSFAQSYGSQCVPAWFVAVVPFDAWDFCAPSPQAGLHLVWHGLCAKSHWRMDCAPLQSFV